jgi:phage terminase large subunit
VDGSQLTRARGYSRPERSPYGDLAAVCEGVAAAGSGVSWPSPKYQSDPVGFCREVLAFEPWSRQVEILESVRDHRNTTVRSGHKIGKSTIVAALALWFWCSFARACVPLTAVKASQIDEAVWKEVRRLHRGAVIPLGGELHTLSRSGLRDLSDDRKIWGITAREGEGVAGISGPNVLLIVDEASGVHDRFFEVLGSSMAGSGGTVRKIYIGNPTRTAGEFWRSHNTQKSAFHAIHVSSETTPNATGTGVVPGLAGPEWIAEKKTEYGEDSPTYAVRVRGEFAAGLEGKIISTELLTCAQEAWGLVADEGQLQIGVDPAGDGVNGDEVAIAVRRGLRMSSVLAWRGISEESIVAHALGLLAQHRRAREAIPRIAVDAGGGIGTRVHAKLRAYLDANPDAFDLVEVRSDRKMWGSPEFDMVRDALFGEMRAWLENGGALPADLKLAQDLNAASFTADPHGRYVATDKKALRKALGRSPDRGDAANLAVWGWRSAATVEESAQADEQAARLAAPAVNDGGEDDERGGGGMDPWAGLGQWGSS